MKNIFLMLMIGGLSLLFASDIEIENAYARATPPKLPNSAVFLSLKNSSNKDISLKSASSDVSKVVELHTHKMVDGAMKMYQIPKIDIPANGKTTLKPGGLHIMLIGLKHALKVGNNVTVTLKFSNGETKTVTAPIKTVMSGMKHGNHMMHKK